MRVPGTILDDGEPVDEARDVALAISTAVAPGLRTYLNRQRRLTLVSLIVLAAGVLVGWVIPTMNGTGANMMLIGAGVVGGAGTYWYASSQNPDIAVTGIERRYWTGHAIPTDEGTMVFDATETVDPTTFELPELDDPSVLQDAEEKLGNVDDLPAVMPHGTTVEDDIHRSLNAVQEELESTNERTIQAPLLATDDQLTKSVDSLSSHATAESHPLESEDLTFGVAQDTVKTIQELEGVAFEDDAERELGSLENESTSAVEDVTDVQADAIDLLNDHLGTAADLLTLQSYAFYCPSCHDEDVVSRVEPVDKTVSTWLCVTCNSRFEESDDTIIPKHRMKDDLVEEIWDRLWIEKDDQRREIYENIEDQQEDLKEREFELRREEIQSATDRIQDLRTNLKDYEAQARAAEGAIEEVGGLLEKYDRIQQQRLEQFTADVEEALSDIEERVEEELKQNRVDREELIEQAQEDIEEQAELKREEEMQLEKDLIAYEMEQQAELEREKMEMYAGIEQEKMEMRSDIEETKFEQEQALAQSRHEDEMAQRKHHHNFDKLMDTRGGVSPFGFKNKFHLAKGRIFGHTKHKEN